MPNLKIHMSPGKTELREELKRVLWNPIFMYTEKGKDNLDPDCGVVPYSLSIKLFENHIKKVDGAMYANG